MENYTYSCAYCGKEYVPRRRKIQKYCSNTCRVKAHFQRNKGNKLNTENGLSNPSKEKEVTQNSELKGTINLAGIGNAAIANIATDGLKKLFTQEVNKPATKGDIKKLIAEFKNRYDLIKNIPVRGDGSRAYFDNETKQIVYLKAKESWKL